MMSPLVAVFTLLPLFSIAAAIYLTVKLNGRS